MESIREIKILDTMNDMESFYDKRHSSVLSENDQADDMKCTLSTQKATKNLLPTSEAVNIFSNNILMQGKLQKRGVGGLQMWKERYFILRGQHLEYYKVLGDAKCGDMRGKIRVRKAKASVADSSYYHHFSIQLSEDTAFQVRDFAAYDEVAMSDWITAINASANANVFEPSIDTIRSTELRTTRVILIRHGQYHNALTDVSDVDKKLTDIGHEQADATGQFLFRYLKSRLVHERFPQITIYHSDLTRARETAMDISKHFPNAFMHQNVLLREAWPCAPLPNMNAPTSRGQTEAMLADSSRLKVAYRTFFNHLSPQDDKRPSVSLEADQVADFENTFPENTTSIRIGDRYRIIVCHANIIRWFICQTLGVDPECTWGKMRYNHCGITEIDIDASGHKQLGTMNQFGHLKGRLITEA